MGYAAVLDFAPTGPISFVHGPSHRASRPPAVR